MKQPNSHGIAGLEALLIVAMVLLIAGIGAFVYTKNHHGSLPFSSTKATPVTYVGSSNSTSPNGIPGGATGTSQATTNPVAATTVIKVTEAGFQISVPANLKDLTYRVTGTTTKTVTFSTTSLTAAIPSCAATSGNGAFDTITSGPGTYQPPANSANGKLLQQYATSYLAYTLPVGPCAKGLSTDNQNLLDDQAQAFTSALTTVKSL
jgi:hypothetical protein